jgi:hypothetical protein
MNSSSNSCWLPFRIGAVQWRKNKGLIIVCFCYFLLVLISVLIRNSSVNQVGFIFLFSFWSCCFEKMTVLFELIIEPLLSFG